MKGDFSKLRFDAKKHYHDVLMQQGRVMLDSDWNEQGAIEAYRTETGMQDIIGNSGAPMFNSGFSLQPADNSGRTGTTGSNIRISAGHMYVDGILCENEANIVFADQPDFAKTTLPTDAGTYMFYLDVWQRHISVLEDGSIREVALGGPDTTTRSKTIWQVRCIAANSGTRNVTCLTDLPADIIPLSTGLMAARPEQAVEATDPCGLTASGGYRRVENQLYRVEVHTVGTTRGASKFKWSRDNGSVAVLWDSVDTNKLTVSSAGRDELLGFKSGNWVELIDDTTDLLGKPGVMVQLSKVDGNILTVNSATTVVRSTNNPRIRRWDGILTMNTADAAWLKLEDGVEVNFGDGIYKTGDYWLIPARTAIADVEWPKYKDNNGKDKPLPLPAHGIHHHVCKLAILELNASQWTLKSDCRPIFPHITELTNLFYVSGDGQEGMPDTELPATLQVGVANGKWPVQGARIKFEIISGGGTLTPLNVVNGFATTDVNGVAQCKWKLAQTISPPFPLLQVKASLVDAANNVVPSEQLPVIFNASFSNAANVFYKPVCTNWPGTEPGTVAVALDQLCEGKPALYYVGGDGQEAMPGKKLPVTLKVGVDKGEKAVVGAKIKFEVVSGGGSVSTTNATTNAQGIAECEWTLGTSTPDLKLQVKASLLDAANNVMQQQLPIIFNASFSIAENVAYTPKCTNWAGTPPDTVAKALDQLCERKSENSAGCSYTIGPEGDFKTLPEAITKLTEKKELFVSLCYMPGNHVIDENIMMVEMKRNFKILKITGYAAIIDMKAEKIDLVADKLILQGLNLTSNPKGTKPNNGGTGSNPGVIEINPTEIKDINSLIKAATAVSNNAQIRLIAGEIIMDYCTWRRGGTSTLPFISVINEGLVYLTNNKIFALPSLDLANGVQGVIEKNEFTTVVLQSGNSKEFSPQLFSWNQNEKEELKEKFINGADIKDWSLAIRGNRVIRIVTDMEPANPNSVYHNMIISENIFSSQGNSFAARFVNMINNQFLHETKPGNQEPNATVAFVIGERLIITGNIGENVGEDGNALFHDLIDVIVLKMIRGANESNSVQNFNLISVVR